MTSLAILPQLKRTITDIMDEELYQSPTSPTVGSNLSNSTVNATAYNQVNNNNNTNNSFYNANSNNNQLINYNYNYNSSRNSINSINSSANVIPNNNLGNVLNIPDSFLEQLTSQEYIDHLKSQQQQHGQQQQQQQAMFDSDDIYSQDFMSQQPQQVNPFNDYGNPNSFIRPLQQQQTQQDTNTDAPLPQTFPTRRRRKITLLNDGIDGASSNKKKHFDEDYMLYNPNISPGQIVNQNELDSSLIIPPNSNDLFLSEQDQSAAFDNDLIIPGYENDYLFLDVDDEQIEEDVSDDEGDNYFQVDEDFDDFMINNSNSNFDDFSNFDNYSNNNDSMKLQENVQEFEQPREVSPSAISSQDNDDDMMVDIDDEVSVKQEETTVPVIAQPERQPAKKSGIKEGSGKSKKHHHHHSSHSISGAEITANNPNHQCNLINPSTGEPCNKQFSRPYDLIRHQDTIHATMKKIFRCVICEDRLHGGPGNGKDKTFSRGDALSRHIKIKHGLVGQDALDLINDAKANVEYVPV